MSCEMCSDTELVDVRSNRSAWFRDREVSDVKGGVEPWR